MTVWTQQSYIFYIIIIRVAIQMIYLYRNSPGGWIFLIPPT